MVAQIPTSMSVMVLALPTSTDKLQSATLEFSIHDWKHASTSGFCAEWLDGSSSFSPRRFNGIPLLLPPGDRGPPVPVDRPEMVLELVIPVRLRHPEQVDAQWRLRIHYSQRR